MLSLFKSNRQFRILLAYQIFSGLGGGVFGMFMLLSIHLLYQNPMYTGIAGFLMAAPAVFSFAVGPLVDRKNKVTIMRLTTLLEFFVLALVTFTPLMEQIGVIFMFGVIVVYCTAALFENPASNALLPQIVKEDEILPANSLIQIAALTGGIGIAVILFTALGEDMNLRYIYGLSTVLLAMAFASALFLRDPSAKKEKDSVITVRFKQDLLEGISFLRGNVLRFIALAFIARMFVAEMGAVNMPRFAETHVGAQGYIVFTMVALVSGIFASFFAGLVGKKLNVGWILFALTVLGGVSRIIFVLVLPNVYIAGLLALATYALLLNIGGITFRSMMQKLPPKDKVGRVDTLFTTFAAIFVALGALAGGFIGRAVEVVDHVFILQGTGYAIIGILLFLVPVVRKLPKLDELKRDEDAE
ncbi:MAG: MFS transporter [Defluviitaleaceae bacterium]|nr:MFS transporter [Defluviitaleaceae bacterium]MCL2276100.1 MFS transporter [Defluviitaleaceae bacterium]